MPLAGADIDSGRLAAPALRHLQPFRLGQLVLADLERFHDHRVGVVNSPAHVGLVLRELDPARIESGNPLPDVSQPVVEIRYVEGVEVFDRLVMRLRNGGIEDHRDHIQDRVGLDQQLQHWRWLRRSW